MGLMNTPTSNGQGEAANPIFEKMLDLLYDHVPEFSIELPIEVPHTAEQKRLFKEMAGID